MTDTRDPAQPQRPQTVRTVHGGDVVALSLATALVAPGAAAYDGAVADPFAGVEGPVYVYDSTLAQAGEGSGNNDDEADDESEPEDDVGYGIYEHDSRLTS